ncbi:hypothetical protein ACFSHP_24085 [Novosphingobium panipatense]
MTAGIEKALTGIEGFDDITMGGLPAAGRHWSADRPVAARRCLRPRSS